MPQFRSTHNIFKDPGGDTIHDDNWFDSDKPVYPPTFDWDYQRPMTIEDVAIWEMIWYASGGFALYAAWCPYAEFYMITHEQIVHNPSNLELFYGPMAMENAYKRARELGMPLPLNKVWVDDKDMWLHVPPPPEEKKIIIL